MEERVVRADFYGPVDKAVLLPLRDDFRLFFLEVCEAGIKEAERMFDYLEEAACFAIQEEASCLFFSGVFDERERQIRLVFKADCRFMFAPPPAVRVPDTRLLLREASLSWRDNELKLCFVVLTEDELNEGERAV